MVETIRYDLYIHFATRLLTVHVNSLGEVLYLSVLGKSIIILNTEEAAVELLDQRNAIYSDRPRFPMQDLCVVFLLSSP